MRVFGWLVLVVWLVGFVGGLALAQETYGRGAAGSETRAERDERGAEEPLVLEIWPGRAPGDLGEFGAELIRMSPKRERKVSEATEPSKLITNVTKPSISVRRPAKEIDTGTAMLIFPGGGYWDLYWEVEGEEVADFLTSKGITAILLKYRVPRRAGEAEREPAPRPLQDAQRAVSLVRSKAKEWGIHPERIGVVGFSAGGHLAISTATRFDERAYEAKDEIDKVSCRPDFAVAVYSGYLKHPEKDELASGIRIAKGTPPVFLVHGGDDVVSSPEHSVVMYLALKRAGVPSELHVYSGVTHGFGVRKIGAPAEAWSEACLKWLGQMGVIEVRGKE